MGAAIQAIRSYLPERRVSNEDLAREFGDWDVAKIYQKTGIATRAIAGPDECASDLGISAARRLFSEGLCSKGDIDFVLFCTQSPDYFLPATACLVQSALGLSTSCGAVDINQGCSGFVYGLSIAKGLIESKVARGVLLITAETYSKYIHPLDRSVRTIFGDGASATLVCAVESSTELLGPFVLGTDGSGAEQLIVRAGAARMRRSASSAEVAQDPAGSPLCSETLYMNGPEIFSFTLQRVPDLVCRTLQKASLKTEDVDLFVFHQANAFMLEHLRKKLGIPPDKFCVNMAHYGNTVSSTIPMALEKAIADGQAKAGNRVMVVGFGVGYSWGAGLLRLI